MIVSRRRMVFGRRHLPASTLASLDLVGTSAAFVHQARQFDESAARAGVPFFAWFGFATVLDAALGG